MAVRRRKIADYYDDLESCYMDSRTSFPDEINQKGSAVLYSPLISIYTSINK